MRRIANGVQFRGRWCALSCIALDVRRFRCMMFGKWISWLHRCDECKERYE